MPKSKTSLSRRALLTSAATAAIQSKFASASPANSHPSETRVIDGVTYLLCTRPEEVDLALEDITKKSGDPAQALEATLVRLKLNLDGTGRLMIPHPAIYLEGCPPSPLRQSAVIKGRAKT